MKDLKLKWQKKLNEFEIRLFFHAVMKNSDQEIEIIEKEAEIEFEVGIVERKEQKKEWKKKFEAQKEKLLEQRKEDLRILEEKALNEFGSLDAFLAYCHTNKVMVLCTHKKKGS